MNFWYGHESGSISMGMWLWVHIHVQCIIGIKWISGMYMSLDQWVWLCDHEYMYMYTV